MFGADPGPVGVLACFGVLSPLALMAGLLALECRLPVAQS